MLCWLWRLQQGLLIKPGLSNKIDEIFEEISEKEQEIGICYSFSGSADFYFWDISSAVFTKSPQHV